MAERELIVRVIGDDRSLQAMALRDQKAVAKLGTELEVTGGRFSKFNQSLRGGLSGVGGRSSLLFGSGAFLSTAALTAGLKTSIDAASDLNEQITKSQAVFRGSSRDILDWSKTTAQSIGVSQEQALEAAGTFGNLFRSIHLGADQTADVSKRLVQLASDLASFNNADPGQVLQDLRSGLVGEAEPLRKFGILLSEARVQQEALKETGKASVKSLTDQEKALARISIIFKDSATAQGDFGRTSEGLANQQRILSAEVKNLEANLGTLLLPGVKQLAASLVDVTNQANNVVTALGKLGDVKIPTIHIPFAFDVGGGGELGDIFKKALLGGAETLPNLGPLVHGLEILAAARMKETTDGATPRLAAQFRASLGGFFQDALDQAAKDIPTPKVTGTPGFATGLTPEDILGPLITDIPKRLQEQLLDVEIATPDNHKALIDALQKQKRSLLEALDDPRLKADQRIELKQKLKGVLGAISGEKDAIQSAVDDANRQRTAALEDAKRAQDEAKQKHLEQLQKIQQAREEEAQRAAEILQAKQFRALGLGPQGDAIIPGVDNLRKQLDQLAKRLDASDIRLPDKLSKQLQGVRKVLSGELGKATSESRDKINELFKTIRQTFDRGSDKAIAEQRSVQLSDKILKALGFDKDLDVSGLARMQRVPAFNAPSLARAAGATQTTGAGGVTITGPVTVVADNPDAFLRELQKRAGRTSGTARGRFPGRSLGLG